MISEKVKVEIPDTSPEVLATRVKKGIEIANNIWQKMKTCDETEYQKLSPSLDNVIRRLWLLQSVARDYGVNECVFGECKFSDDFFCFACTKK